jgi:2-oxoglutarate dehydrogenase E2 component (dihydrolipoamide succinyltransferase)
MQKVEIKETTISTTNNASISNENTNIVPMDRMRKLIADHMIKSIQTSAHVCSFIEADLTNIVTWRNENKSKFKEKYGENLTFTPILIEAIAKALVEFPILTASLDGNNIIYKKDINIGMAAALPDGNLIVPVIKNADMLNLLGLAKKVNELGARAKKNQLKPDEIQGGTYTMTNLGSFGNLFGTPIINQPQVAILGVGAIVKKPVVVESNSQESIAIRSMMYLSHSYDHRVIDGFVGGTFVKRVAEILEGFDVNREI